MLQWPRLMVNRSKRDAAFVHSVKPVTRRQKMIEVPSFHGTAHFNCQICTALPEYRVPAAPVLNHIMMRINAHSGPTVRKLVPGPRGQHADKPIRFQSEKPNSGRAVWT